MQGPRLGTILFLFGKVSFAHAWYLGADLLPALNPASMKAVTAAVTDSVPTAPLLHGLNLLGTRYCCLRCYLTHNLPSCLLLKSSCAA